MLTRAEYDIWLATAPDDLMEIEDPLVAILYAHVLALQDRLDKLIDPEDHDRGDWPHGRGCKCYHQRCACAYDYPTDVCMVHEIRKVL